MLSDTMHMRSSTKHARKLNVHYYEALKRALYKPAAFFKGIVFPLLEVRPLCMFGGWVRGLMRAPDRLLVEGGRDCRVRARKGQDSTWALRGCSHAAC